MHYDQHSNGQAIDAKLNEEVELSLAESRTAGYRWVTKKSGEPVLKLLEDSIAPNTAATGGTGHHVWRFRAVAPGEASLEFHYVRPWETSVEPARTFAMKVRVRS
jgi:inhibitor of cysteine peptidase